MESGYYRIRNVEEAAIAPFLDSVAAHLGLVLAAEVPDGIGRLNTEVSQLSYAVRRDIKFAAFRWVERGAQPVEVESFFLWPAAKPPRSGVRVTSLLTDGPSIEHAFVQRWQEAVGGAESTGLLAIPDFVELVGILASDGAVTSTNGELLARLSAMESELEYARIEVGAQQRELETARENIKLMAVNAGEWRRDALRHRDSSATEQPPRHTGDLALLLPSWAQSNRERIVVLPRAIAGAKKSQYESPETVMAALEFLAGPYREHRRGALSRAKFEEILKSQPFQLNHSVAPNIAGEQGDQYYVRWGGRRVFLDQHLLKGGGREPRYCMRIYFFWDSVSSRAVVGSLPFHLENSLS